MNNLLTELRRRNVFRVAMVYGVAAWLIAQVSVMLENAFALPPWFDTLVISLLLLGFPIALILSWAFELTPEGFRATGSVADAPPDTDLTVKKKRSLNRVIMAGLALAVAVLLFREFTGPSAPSETHIAQSQATQTQAGDSETEDTKQSIAVLPFEDFSEGQTEDYFARGISEELLNVLARIDGLRVASRTSAFAFKDEGKSVSEIAAALNVAHVLEGSIRKSGTTLRITAQLIDTSNDEHLWSETYDRPLTAENLFEVQDEIAGAIVTALKGELTVKPPEASGRTLSLEAYETYLKAREDHNKRLPEPLKAAEAGFQEVITLDPKFAPAYSGLADTYLLMFEYAGMDRNETIRLAEPNVKRALALAPNSAEALTSAALLAIASSDPETGLDYAARAIAANPNYSVAYHRQGLAYNGKNQYALGLASFKKGLVLDPASFSLQSNIAGNQRSLGDYEGARASAEALIRNHPDSPHGYGVLANLLSDTGDYESMHRTLKDSQALNPKATSSNGALSFFYTNIGLFELAQSIAPTPTSEAYIHIVAGDTDQARTVAKSLTSPYAHYLLGDRAETYEAARKIVETRGVFSPETIGANVEFAAVIAHIYAREGDPDAKNMIKTLDNYYQDKGPADINRNNDLEGGVILQLAKGNPKAALPWIDRMLDLGLIYRWLDLAPYDDLRNDPEFTARLVRHEQIRAHVREAIDAQLANPPENWLTVDSSVKGVE